MTSLLEAACITKIRHHWGENKHNNAYQQEILSIISFSWLSEQASRVLLSHHGSLILTCPTQNEHCVEGVESGIFPRYTVLCNPLQAIYLMDCKGMLLVVCKNQQQMCRYLVSCTKRQSGGTLTLVEENNFFWMNLFLLDNLFFLSFFFTFLTSCFCRPQVIWWQRLSLIHYTHVICFYLSELPSTIWIRECTNKKNQLLCSLTLLSEEAH